MPEIKEGDIVYFRFGWATTEVRIDQICDGKHVYFTVVAGMYRGSCHYRPMDEFVLDVATSAVVVST